MQVECNECRTECKWNVAAKSLFLLLHMRKSFVY